jgi:SOS response regulatory protein OraA/RecX
LDVISVDDLRRKLRENGYSEKAVREILKWYQTNNP